MTNDLRELTTGTETLRARLRGPLLLPSDTGYDTEQHAFQTASDCAADVVVGAEDTTDVREAVAFAREHELPVSVRCTGHGPAPRTEGMLITTRRMNGVRVDPDRGRAWIDAGVPWSEVIDAAARHGLAPLSGSAPHVGAVSYTLGGGMGMFARRYGYAADHVSAVEIVTADAVSRRVTAESDPDLFWGLRGGSGNFGVVTAMEIGLVPVRRLHGGGLFFDTASIGDVLRTWSSWTTQLPEQVTSSVALIPFPDLPQVPEPLRGRHVAHVRVADLDDPDTAHARLAPLRAAGRCLRDTVADIPATAVGSICADPVTPMPYYASNRMLHTFDATTVDTLVRLCGPKGPMPCVVEVRHLGGALGRSPSPGNAVGHRDARYVVGLNSAFSGPAPTDDELERVRADHDGVLREMHPWSTGGQCLNFLSGHTATSANVRAAYHADDHQRLTELKRRHDPGNVFRFNHNIPPAE